MIHAQLDSNNICTGYGNLTNIESVPTLVYLPDGWDEDLLWRKYENGVWSTDKFAPAIIPPPSISLENRVKAAEDAIVALMGL